MKEAVARILSGFEQQAGESLKTKDLSIEAVKEHPKFFVMLILGFLFGFGFMFALGYFVYRWLRDRSGAFSHDETAPADELVP